MNENPYAAKAEELLTLADKQAGHEPPTAAILIARAQVEATLALTDELRRLRAAAYRSS